MEKNRENFYITTPIYYPSNKLTLGNSYTTIVCDAIARFNRNVGMMFIFKQVLMSMVKKLHNQPKQ